MRLPLLALWLIALPALAQQTFRNDREGDSFYLDNSGKALVAELSRDFQKQDISTAFRLATNESLTKFCSYDINREFQKNLQKLKPGFTDVKAAILYARSLNEMDDVVTGILLKANETVTLPLEEKDPQTLSRPNRRVQAQALSLVASFPKRFQENACLDDAFRNLRGELQKLDKDLKTEQLEGLLYEARKKKLISPALFVTLEQAREQQIDNEPLSLRAYKQKIASLRTQFPLRDANEKSNFVAKKAAKLKISRRQVVLQTYTDLQIMLMADVVKRLRARLESPKVEIVIHEKNDASETIDLDPMERFRLAIKLLRKEMHLLELNTYFNGRVPSYMDLMISSYEVGIIPAAELEEVAGLEDIWDPKKTFWQKAEKWATTFSTVATIALPQPWGFIPALAVVAIEMISGQKKDKQDDDTSIF